MEYSQTIIKRDGSWTKSLVYRIAYTIIENLTSVEK